MGDYIALHNRAGRLPRRFESVIPNDTVWIREDQYDSPLSRQHIIGHEQLEKEYMDKGLSYKEAHWRAELIFT